MRKLSAMLAVALMSTAAMAQGLNSGYFTDGYLYRHELNPAYGGDGYIAMPFILGNMSVSMGGNLGLKNLLYNRNGKTVTFLHPDVAVSEAMNSFHNTNKIVQDLKYQLIGVGFKAFGGHNTIGISVRENMGLALPYDLFRLAKEPLTNGTYDLSGLGLQANAFTEIALGHSRQINDQLRVGAKAKILLGMGNAEMKTNTANLILDENGYQAEMDAEMRLNMSGVKFEYNEDNPNQIEGIDEVSAGLGGGGIAFDLGAEYKLNDDWAFSASLLDLGFIHWNKGASNLASTNGLKQFNSNDYTFNTDEDSDNNFEDMAEKMGDDLKELYQLEEQPQKAHTTCLGVTMNIAAEYTAPFYRGLKFGLLSSSRFQGKYSWTECRLSANVAPCKVFSAGVNMAVGTFGTTFGWIMNLNTHKGFSLFLGMDRVPAKLSKQSVPVSSNAQMSMGINFPF